MTPMHEPKAHRSAEELIGMLEQWRYDVGNPLARYLINRRRRKRGKSPLRPTP